MDSVDARAARVLGRDNGDRRGEDQRVAAVKGREDVFKALFEGLLVIVLNICRIVIRDVIFKDR